MSGLLVPDWPAPANVHACTTLRGTDLPLLRGTGLPPLRGTGLPPLRDAGVPSLRDGGPQLLRETGSAAVHGGARLSSARLAPPAEPRWLKQVHGTRVVRSPRALEEADASVTSEPGVVLAIRTADCLPVLFASDDGQEIGAAHAGWRGLAAGMLEATLDAMDTPPAQLVAWLGPAAGPANYEVGDEVRAAFAGHETHFRPTRPGHWLVDLYAIARDKLAARGLARVSGGEWCTIGDPSRFYSYRRDGSTGRHVTLVWRD